MNLSQLPRSAPHCVLRPVSPRCALVSTLLSDARVVAPSARRSQSSRQKLLLPARNANRNVPSFCSALDSHQERFRSIRFTSLSPRGGTRTLMVNPTLPERISRSAINCVAQCRVFADSKAPAAPHKPSTRFTVRRGTSSVGLARTCVSNAPAHIVLSLHSRGSVPYLCCSRLLPVRSLQGLPSGQNGGV